MCVCCERERVCVWYSAVEVVVRNSGVQDWKGSGNEGIDIERKQNKTERVRESEREERIIKPSSATGRPPVGRK